MRRPSSSWRAQGRGGGRLEDLQERRFRRRNQAYGLRDPEQRERERERDESAVLTHLHTAPVGAQRSLITSVRNDFTCTPFPVIRFDPAPSPKNPLALKPGYESPDPSPILCFAPAPVTPWPPQPFKYYHTEGLIGRGEPLPPRPHQHQTPPP
jgi:hypothetical protein